MISFEHAPFPSVLVAYSVLFPTPPLLPYHARLSVIIDEPSRGRPFFDAFTISQDHTAAFNVHQFQMEADFGETDSRRPCCELAEGDLSHRAPHLAP